MAEHKCYSESQTKRISSRANSSCWERLAHRRNEGISFQQHPHPQEKPALHKRDWTVRCTWALPLSIFYILFLSVLILVFHHFLLTQNYKKNPSKTTLSHLDWLPWTLRLLTTASISQGPKVVWHSTGYQLHLFSVNMYLFAYIFPKKC